MNATHTIGSTGRRRVVVTPSRDDLIDAGMLVLLMCLALIGFRTTFSGSLYLVAAAAGIVLGLGIGHLANVLQQPMIAVAAVSIGVFFLLGGAIALRSTAIAGVLPSGSTLSGLASESVHGWKDLLTTLPPVDGGGPLVVLPYMLGLFGGVGGFSFARRTAHALTALVVPAIVLILVILLGTQSPAAQLLQGTGFGIAALAWVAIRSQRQVPVSSSGSGRVARSATVAALLVVAAAGSAVVGPHLPGAGDHRRLVLRSYVDQPFDVGQYPSPLSAFRIYTPPTKNSVYRKVLFTVNGLPAGTPVRIATLDSYDGITWRASNSAQPVLGPPDTFQRVGTTIDSSALGRAVTFTVRIGQAYQNVWLPDAGSLTGLSFHGSDAGTQEQYFRYNLGTGTGISPVGLSSQDSYTAHAIVPVAPDLTALDSLAEGVPLDSGTFLKPNVAAWAGSGSAAQQVLSVARHLYQVGRYTNGEGANAVYLPGHYRYRLANFLDGPEVAGDDEQFAAAYALMVNQLGVPARVVLGAVPEANGTVRGRDVHAWVEVQLSDATWRAIPTDAFMNEAKKATKQQQPQQQQQSGQVVPPPSHGHPRSSLEAGSDALSRSSHTSSSHKHAASRWELPGWVVATAKGVGAPILLIALLCALIVAIKSERRRRRRTRGSPAHRLERGWREVLDLARDLGAPSAATATRREQASTLRGEDAPRLAGLADAYIFGPNEPQDADAAGFWREVDRTRRSMSDAVSRRRRLRAALSLASLLHRGPATGPA